MPDQQPIVVPDGSAIITPNQQYAELQATRAAVERLANTIDPALLDIRKDIHDMREDHKEQAQQTRAALTAHSVEIAALQRWRSAITAGLVLLSMLVGWGALNVTKIGG